MCVLFFNCIIRLYKEIVWLIYLQPFPIFSSTGDIFHIMVNNDLNWSPVQPWADMGPLSFPPFKEHGPISNANILQWRITSFLEWRKPTRINQISNTPCGFFSNLAFAGMRNQSKQSSHSPWPSPTSYIPSGQAAPSSAPLVQPDILDKLLFPSLYYPSLLPSLLLFRQHKNLHPPFLWFLSVV